VAAAFSVHAGEYTALRRRLLPKSWRCAAMAGFRR
jgi:hypothetical protein